MPTTTQAERASSATARRLPHSFQLIPYQDLEIPMEYQRPRNEKLIRRIAEHFDPDAFQALAVNERPDGTYWVMDGQQRLRGIERMGWTDQNLPCIVSRRETTQQEAQVFTTINVGRVPLRPVEAFKGRLHAEDPTALAIKAILDECGVDLMTSGAYSDRGTTAVGALETVYHSEGGPDLLRTTLSLLKETFGGQKGAYTGKLLLGTAMFLARYGRTYRRGEFVAKLGRVPVSAIMRQAALFQDVAGANPAGAVGRALRHLYNLAKRSQKLGIWEEAGPQYSPHVTRAQSAERAGEVVTRLGLRRAPATSEF